MGNFSRQPSDELRAAQDKGYVGLHVEQGVPVLDRDLNLLADLVSFTLRHLVQRYIGDGLALGDGGFLVQPMEPPSNDIIIGPGSILAGGFELTNPAVLSYFGQAGLTPDERDLSPPSSGTRTDCVYIDVSLQEITSNDDGSLGNDTDVGMQTSIRLRPTWMIRVAKGLNHVPTAPAGHVYAEIAWLVQSEQSGPVITGAAIVDRRPARMRVAETVWRLDAAEFALAPRFLTPGSPSTLVAPGSVVLLSGFNFDIGVDLAHGEDNRLGWVLFTWGDADTQRRAVPVANVRQRSDRRPGLEVLVPIEYETTIPRTADIQISVRTLFGTTVSDCVYGLSKVLAFASPPFYWDGSATTSIPAGETLVIQLTADSRSASYLVALFSSGNPLPLQKASVLPTDSTLEFPLSTTLPAGVVSVQVTNDEGRSIAADLTIESAIPKFDTDNPFEPSTELSGGTGYSMYPGGKVTLWLSSGSATDTYNVRLVAPEGGAAPPVELGQARVFTEGGKVGLETTIPAVVTGEPEIPAGSLWRFQVTSSAGRSATSPNDTLFEVEQELPVFSDPLLPTRPNTAPPGATVYVLLRRVYDASYSVFFVFLDGTLAFQSIVPRPTRNDIAAKVPTTERRGEQRFRVSNQYQRYLEAMFTIEAP